MPRRLKHTYIFMLSISNNTLHMCISMITNCELTKNTNYVFRMFLLNLNHIKEINSRINCWILKYRFAQQQNIRMRVLIVQIIVLRSLYIGKTQPLNLDRMQAKHI